MVRVSGEQTYLKVGEHCVDFVLVAFFVGYIVVNQVQVSQGTQAALIRVRRRLTYQALEFV